MINIKSYDSEKDLLTVQCTCGEVFISDLSQMDLQFLPEFGMFENLSLPCPSCNTIHFLNMNIPAGDYEEMEIEMEIMPFQDINNRKILRDVMWNTRPDLKQLDREEYNNMYLQEWKKTGGE